MLKGAAEAISGIPFDFRGGNVAEGTTTNLVLDQVRSLVDGTFRVTTRCAGL